MQHIIQKTKKYSQLQVSLHLLVTKGSSKCMVMHKIYTVLALLMLKENATETHKNGPITITTITTTTSSFSLKD